MVEGWFGWVGGWGGSHLNQRLKIKMDGVTGTFSFSEVHSVTAQSASSKGQTGALTLKPSAPTDRLQTCQSKLSDAKIGLK